MSFVEERAAGRAGGRRRSRALRQEKQHVQRRRPEEKVT